ncbi:MAG: hypothetical protein WCC26_08510 [Terracidiphilus sp.]
MTQSFPAARRRVARLIPLATLALGAACGLSAQGFFGQPQLFAGNLIVSRSVYDNRAGNVTVGQQLPPNCTAANCVAATNSGTYPYVFNNVLADASFGITSRIFLDQITPFGFPVDTIEIPNSLQFRINGKSDQLVTSFSSKSEIGLHLSTDGRYLTFMGYVAPVNTIDVSNSNTPAVIDSTNPVPGAVYRAVALLDNRGNLSFTETNAYSGNNGRSAILNNSWGNDVFYTAGNAGNGSNPQPTGVVLGAGAQFISPVHQPEFEQTPGAPTPVASFSVTELGDKADKIGKDDNFRGMTVFNNVLYYTKGSGGNGVNTVYFVDTTGTACPKGVGLPVAGAKLPTAPLAFDPSTLAADGLPSNMCVLAGFPTLSNKSGNPVNFPFGLWFANANTLYVADEGDGYAGGTDLYTHAAAQTNAGLEKWILNASTKQWQLAYVLTNGLNLGAPYTVFGYPTGTNSATSLPWAPTTDGLRNITGQVNRDGTVTIWAITSTTSGGGDTGADPDKLVVITDSLKAATLPASEKFFTLRTAGFGEVLRGVSFTPGTGDGDNDGDDFGR